MKTTIEGKFNSALCYTVNVDNSTALEPYTIAQVKAICDKEIYKDAKIVIMPDAHPGKVGPIGLTMKINGDTPIMPALIGNDIGCGTTTVKFIPKHKLTVSDFKQLDVILRSNTKNYESYIECFDNDSYYDGDIITDTYIYERNYINTESAKKNYGTLGGGNHFIEIDTDENGEYYLTVHSGSRSMGNDVYEHFMDAGRKELQNNGINIPYEDTYLCDKLRFMYMMDTVDCDIYASSNRDYIINNIAKEMKWKIDYNFMPLRISHNMIDCNLTDLREKNGKDIEFIIHKGSISAKKGEKVIIPINMRDGIILGYGKGNEEWNCSAPHGSGRIIKRSEVKNSVTLNMFKKSMEGIYSPSIDNNTLDESPFAYRDIDLIKDAISDTVEITNILKPVYNFKNGGNE